MYKYQDYHEWGYASQIQEACRQIILQYHNLLVVYPSHETSRLYIDVYIFCFCWKVSWTSVLLNLKRVEEN